MLQQINNNLHCKPGSLLGGNLKRSDLEHRASHLRTGKTNRGSRERERRRGERKEGMAQREGKGGQSFCAPIPPLFWHSIPQGIVCLCLSPLVACELLKDQDHALFLCIPTPAQSREKGLR